MGSWRVEEGTDVVAEINQLPIRLAWAITIHKSQGMTLDAAQIDLSKSFVLGMGYVALSRVRTLDSINLLGLNHQALLVDPVVIELDRELTRASKRHQRAIDAILPKDLAGMHDEVIARHKFDGKLQLI